MRRRMMMETKESGAKYPLANGRHEFSEGSYVEVSNGNHVKLHILPTQTYINLSNIEQNSAYPGALLNINNHPEIFTLPAGSHCVLRLKNIQQVNANQRAAVNFRAANGSHSSNFNDDINFSIANNVTIERDMGSDFPVGCFLTWNSSSNFDLEFDVEFTVNGERWI